MDLEYTINLGEELPVITDAVIDLSTYNKGDTISNDVLERVLQVPRNAETYRLSVLAYTKIVHQHFTDRKEPVTIRVFQSTGIKILTDEEALEYNTHRFELETKQRNRAYKRLTQLNRGLLTDNSKNVLDRKLCELGHRIQIDRKAKREPQIPPPTPRLTPER